MLHRTEVCIRPINVQHQTNRVYHLHVVKGFKEETFSLINNTKYIWRCSSDKRQTETSTIWLFISSTVTSEEKTCFLYFLLLLNNSLDGLIYTIKNKKIYFNKNIVRVIISFPWITIKFRDTSFRTKFYPVVFTF